jgi:rubrerythrin
VTGPRTLQDFMVQALAMELEAVERYTEFADAMEMHNNKEVAGLFRTMAGYEGKHAAEIRAQMGWNDSFVPEVSGQAWPGFEAPETVPLEDVHYLMQPWHALHLALEAEQRAEAFFGQLAASTNDDAVRAAALEMQKEEAEHVELVKAWMKKVPEPDPDWDNDPDPPRYNE